tara:strand:+ start:386 stop:511 length:126 start_codon:yes stop_codon:yes gene_type:complete
MWGGSVNKGLFGRMVNCFSSHVVHLPTEKQVKKRNERIYKK